MRTHFTPTAARDKLAHEGVIAQMRDALMRTLARFRPTQAAAAPAIVNQAGGDAAVLRFPIRGEALLVNLASTLRERAQGVEVSEDPFWLTLSRAPRPRLSLDRNAYVEFHAEDSTFHLKIDAVPASRLTLETTEFVTLVKFVLQYLAERHGDVQAIGDAP
jgi:hypothetical protein